MIRLLSLPSRTLAGWSRFWFAPTDPATLGAVRIAAGLVLLCAYAGITPIVLDYIGPNSWVDPASFDVIREQGGNNGRWYGWSIYFLLTDPSQITMVYWGFMASIVAFTFGIFTRLATVLVWVGHVSFVHRANLTWCGQDVILAMITFYLMFAPAGAALSVDRLFRRRNGPPRASWTANLSVRLIQVHMAIVYLCAGLGKLQGSQWWDGTAIWNVMSMKEFAPFDVTRLGELGDIACLSISTLGVLLTLGFEIGFIFLIWNRAARPLMLTLAVLLHAGIGLFMGMSAFGAAMLAGCLAFVEPASITAFLHCFRLSRKPKLSVAPVESVERRAA